ncbi:MAG: YjbQ family protein [bacterium]|nr:YjbQ family protein [bacterium]
MTEISVPTKSKQEIVDITEQVADAVKKSGVSNGLCNVYVPHTSAAVIINECADQNIKGDILKALNKAIPEHDDYKHDDVDNNAAAHIRASILGPSETIHIKDGKLDLGTWQAIMFVEFDGPRSRRVNVMITSV